MMIEMTGVEVAGTRAVEVVAAMEAAVAAER